MEKQNGFQMAKVSKQDSFYFPVFFKATVCIEYMIRKDGLKSGKEEVKALKKY